MIFGTFFISGIAAATTFLQAGERGLRFVWLGCGLAVAGYAVTLVILQQGLSLHLTRLAAALFICGVMVMLGAGAAKLLGPGSAPAAAQGRCSCRSCSFLNIILPFL